MLGNSHPILVVHIYDPNVGKQLSNIGILHLIPQCWKTVPQYWYAIFVIPMLGFILPIWRYYFQILMKTGLEQWDAALKCKDDAGNLLQHWNSTSD